jgi:pimeloyl-ACP methyl ester carboxylesterase
MSVLHHLSVGDEGAPYTAFVLHGILGSARNWRAFARRFATEVPSWRFLLVDLRNHGESPPQDPPHVLSTCAQDLVELADHLGVYPDAVVGHSFGGKVALAYAGLRPPGLSTAWVLDAQPGPVGELAPDNEVRRVFEVLATLPGPFSSRAEAGAAVRDAGLAPAIVAWMTTNLRRDGDVYRWRFDLDGARSMIRDYLDADLWPVVDAEAAEVHLVRAMRSDRWSDNTLAALDQRVAARRLVVHPLDSGHWVHVDDPEGLMRILATTFV